jgi:hypothetical protein
MCRKVIVSPVMGFVSLKFRPSVRIPFPTTSAAWVILIRGDYEADRSCQLVRKQSHFYIFWS